jgi:hypothetical protein
MSSADSPGQEQGRDQSQEPAASHRLRSLFGSVVFGDRLGLVLFLGTVCFAAVYWRAGLFITDNATLTRTLEAVAEGRLWIEPATGEYFDAPGAVTADGLVYGRNYGQIFLALPFLWVLEALDAVADLRVALAALWHLALYALLVQSGRLLDLRRPATVGGSVVVVLSFLLNVRLAAQFTDPSLPLLALQLSTLVAAGLSAVVMYRLVSRQHGRRPGALAGGAVVLVLPVGFWATIPKRHVLVGFYCLSVLYLFARSRDSAGVDLPVVGVVPARRAGMYALIALLAWVHAAEGLFVFLAVVLADVPTAPSNDRRTVAVVAGAFLVASVPLLVTNHLVAGEPHRPPRALYSGLATQQALITGSAAGASTGVTTGGGPIAAALGVLGDFLSDVFVFSAVAYLSSTILALATDGLTGLTHGGDLYHTFVRSGGGAIGGAPQFRGVNLAVLESAPLLAAAIGAAVAPGRWIVSGFEGTDRGVTAADLLAAGMIVSFVLIYVNRLPLHVQVNARYLLPAYPLALYLLVRSRAVRAVVETRLRPLLWTYGFGTLVGTQLVFVYTTSRGLAVAEATQVHALLGLGCAGLLAVTLPGSAIDDRLRTPAAVALGLAGAAGTAFLLLSGLDYFSFIGQYVLPVSETVSGLLGLA